MSDETRVRLSATDLADRAQQLAQAVREAAVMDDEQADARRIMSNAKRDLARRIVALAETVRTGVETQPAQFSLYEDDDAR